MNSSDKDIPLWSRSMQAVISSQFLSAFADNALLFATLALLTQQQYPDWSQPVLQMVFVAAYIICAPFVGYLADHFSKGRVMLFANIFKLVGAGCICLSVNPFIGYTLVGAGAAAYSPAKYGILGELNNGDKLVKANGLMEASTIAAILGGTVLGGMLADWILYLALWLCVLFYISAVVVNLFIPKLPAARAEKNGHPSVLLRQFFSAIYILWQNPKTRFSLCATSLFWGIGAVLRLLLVAWVPLVLHITGIETPTRFIGIMAIGVVIGAGVAAKLVTLQTVQRCMPAGILIGVSVVFFVLQQTLLPAYLLMTLIGIFGGFFVVPLNALLQEQGVKSVGVGNAVAVQNLAENSAMLLMLGLYSLALKIGISITAIGVSFGLLFVLVVIGLWYDSRHGLRSA